MPSWVPRWTRRRWTWGVIAALVLVILILQVTGDDAGQVAEPSEGPLTTREDDQLREQPEPDALPFAEDATLLRRLLVAEESDGALTTTATRISRVAGVTPTATAATRARRC